MKFSQSVLLSIVASMAAVEGLVIPASFKDLPAQFSLDKVEKTVKEIIQEPIKKVVSGITKNVELVAENHAQPLLLREEPIPYGYIIMMKDSISKDAFDFQRLWVEDIQVQSIAKMDPADLSAFGDSLSASGFKHSSGGINHVYDTPFMKGYSGFFTPQVADMMRRHPDVASVEVDSTVHALKASTQVGAPWGLSRISHRSRLGLSNFNQYVYDTTAGEGVTAYIIDTGINVSHQEFEGRAIWGATIPTDDTDEDGNGHGTHCAGTIGSKAYGVSKNAKLVAVKVLKSNGSGSMSDVIKGVEYAANSHLREAKDNKKGFKGSTANMSLGGGKSPSLDKAVNAAVKAGMHFSVAAGNDNADACNSSPAAAEGPITVGASTLSDVRAYFSNFGTCVDIFAPGLNILSTYTGSDTATAVLSGTSMASPHVCGLLTYFLSLQPEEDSLFKSSLITPEELKKDLIKFGTKDTLGDIPEDGTPNLLIFNGAGKELKGFWGSGDDNETEDLERSVRIAESALEENLDTLENGVQVVIDEIEKARKQIAGI
ncbi:proteinase B [Brettanomyces nanus]|uniref:Proteinase B n=1 Tax=Eeniella nana TaxID=13502 RepID=A0A875S6F6_EENNA|nr:proteinase B [Brettanomyces nanus]QPG76528.1 proteinase B [Brettanomyces nanus]